MTDLTFRATAPEELRAAADAVRVALLGAPVSDAEWDRYGPGWQQPGHDSWTAWDGTACVGHAGGFRFDTLVPGGAWLGTCGVTRVGVIPTHTRRGILSRLMTQLLEAAHAEGRPLASLRASEGVIYRRFGFGIAGEAAVLDVNTRQARPLANPVGGTFRLVGRDEALDVIPALYQRIVHRPGVISRDETMWRRYLHDFLAGEAAESIVVHTNDAGEDDGYAHYSVKFVESATAHPSATGELLDLWGSTPQVELALWSYLVGVDLVASYLSEERPLDDIIRLAAADPRAVLTKFRWDEQWVRLLDLEQCLAARTYAADTSVVIDVTDPLFAANGGHWRVRADAPATRTDACADIRTDIAGISAAYMGATSWWELVGSGWAAATDPAAVRRADALFAHRPLTFSGSHF